jgi:hypothetical protein
MIICDAYPRYAASINRWLYAARASLDQVSAETSSITKLTFSMPARR